MARDNQDGTRQGVARRSSPSSAFDEPGDPTFGGPPDLPSWLRDRQLDLFELPAVNNVKSR